MGMGVEGPTLRVRMNSIRCSGSKGRIEKTTLQHTQAVSYGHVWEFRR
jgi:hypothetical protein